MRPWESLPPLGAEAHGLPGSHGSLSRDTVEPEGERKVNRTALGSTRASMGQTGHRPLPENASRCPQPHRANSSGHLMRYEAGVFTCC
jgi:hypothetical protein